MSDKDLNPCKCGATTPPTINSDDMVLCWLVECKNCKQKQHSETSEWTYWNAINKWNKENPIVNNETIYYLKDQTKENMVEWIKGLNASGYAGILPDKGWIVDRREFNNAVAIQENNMFGVVKPKKLEV